MAELNPENLTAAYPANATLAAIAADLQPLGLFWPGGRALDPQVTLGAHLDAGGGGPWRLAWGTARDWVLGLTVRTAGGGRVRLGGPVVKNVAGLDLIRLFIGAGGTLGAIEGAILRLAPLPPASVTLAADFAGGPVAALGALPALLASRLNPAAVDFVAPGRLLVALEGTPADLDRRAAAAAAALTAAGGAVATPAAGAAEGALWAERAAAPARWAAAWGATGPAPGPGAAVVQARAGVPAAAGARLLAAAATALAGRPWAAEGHAGSGVWRLYTPAADLPALAGALAGLRREAAAAGGYLAVVAGPPALADLLPWRAPHPGDALQAAVRRALAAAGAREGGMDP